MGVPLITANPGTLRSGEGSGDAVVSSAIYTCGTLVHSCADTSRKAWRTALYAYYLHVHVWNHAQTHRLGYKGEFARTASFSHGRVWSTAEQRQRLTSTSVERAQSVSLYRLQLQYPHFTPLCHLSPISSISLLQSLFS